MKTLVLIRHAKSDWQDSEIKDFDRPLSDRGNADAPVMAKELHRLGLKPDLIISSPANRAITTAGFFARKFGYSEDKIKQEAIIYNGSYQNYIQVINSVNNDIDCIFLLGHNPEISVTASCLLNNFYEQVPTAACICIDFDIDDWNEIETEKGKLRFFLYPKMIK